MGTVPPILRASLCALTISCVGDGPLCLGPSPTCCSVLESSGFCKMTTSVRKVMCYQGIFQNLWVHLKPRNVLWFLSPSPFMLGQVLLLVTVLLKLLPERPHLNQEAQIPASSRSRNLQDSPQLGQDAEWISLLSGHEKPLILRAFQTVSSPSFKWIPWDNSVVG